MEEIKNKEKSTKKTRAAARRIRYQTTKSISSFYLFESGEAVKAEQGKDVDPKTGRRVDGNRHQRREKIRQPLSNTLRQAKRVDRFMSLKQIAEQIRKRYPKNFKENHKWKEIETEMVKLLSVQGETNSMKPKVKRK